MTNAKIPCINQKKLIRLFRDSINHGKTGADGIRFCFLIGAGASKDSGIKTGQELAKKWYEQIAEDLDDSELEQWQQQNDIDEENLAASYPQIFEERFREEPQIGYDELQRQMQKSDPSIGYIILARILAETRHNFVITTNFDHLVEDALFIATTDHPLICGHESLAPYIQSQSQRPTIIKVHRDLLLTPFNNSDDTERLKKEWTHALAPVLKDFRLVVIGYGGNDGSLMDYLAEIDAEHRQKIFWCVRNPDNINDQTRKVLKDGDALVKIEGFEELMYELNDACDLKSFIDKDDLEKSPMIQEARKKAKEYQKKLTELAERTNLQIKEGKEPSEAIKKLLPNWWDYEAKASAEKDPKKQDMIYQEGMTAFPDSHDLVNNYAIFLEETINDYRRAEKYYLRTLKKAPTSALANHNYAYFLHHIRKNYDSAEKYYQKALKYEPDNSTITGNYSLFLNYIRKDYNKAEKYYLKTLNNDPNEAKHNGNYANFLKAVRNNKKAEKYYLNALSLNENKANHHGNFSGLLLALGCKDEANPILDKAFLLASDRDLLSELWFYVLAHFPERADTARQELDKLLEDGSTSPGWDFSQNIEQAKKEGCSYIEELEVYAKKISRID